MPINGTIVAFFQELTGLHAVLSLLQIDTDGPLLWDNPLSSLTTSITGTISVFNIISQKYIPTEES